MRIWQLCTPREIFSVETGGAIATVVAEISKDLVNEGHEVVIAARSDGTRLHETGAIFESLGGIPWPTSFLASLRWKAESGVNHMFGWAWPAYLSYLASLHKVLRQSASPPDVVISHNDPMVIRFLHRWVPGATIVLWLHNRPYRLPRRHRSADDADRIVTVSDFLAAEVAPVLGVDRQKVMTIHNGVDSSVFHPRPDFELPSTPLQVLCLGRLDVNKGADVALSAVRRLQSEGLAIELDVVGSPWFSPTPGVGPDPWGGHFVEQLVAAGARHIPHIDRGKVPELVRAHDVVCVLSRWDDPFPLVVLEAMASGCAVVATRRGGIPEAAGHAARLVHSDDSDAVVAALRELCTEPGVLATAKRRAREHAVRRPWHRAAERLLSLLEPPVAGPPSDPG